MLRITLKIDGMMCGMCEAHINEKIRRNFAVKKVSSSHTKGETIIIAENDISDTSLEAAIEQTGYHVISVSRESYEKNGLLNRLRKKK